jgi:AcrR family transcriptional regulator
MAGMDPTARRPRGRPVSLKSRQAVLTTAAQLLDERGFHGFTVDEVARRSGVSKATIYKHWTSGFDIAVNAYGDSVTDAVPVTATGDVIHDLASQIRRLAEFYASPRGRVVAQLLAAGTGQADGPALLREKFFAKRRDATRALIESGKASGQLRPGLDPDLVIDMLFGPIVFRLFNGIEPLNADTATALADMALPAIVAEAGSQPPPAREQSQGHG